MHIGKPGSTNATSGRRQRNRKVTRPSGSERLDSKDLQLPPLETLVPVHTMIWPRGSESPAAPHLHLCTQLEPGARIESTTRFCRWTQTNRKTGHSKISGMLLCTVPCPSIPSYRYVDVDVRSACIKCRYSAALPKE